jgi:hypothetical protein
MQALRDSLFMGARFGSTLAALLTWIAFVMGVSARLPAQTGAEAAAAQTELSTVPVVPQQVRYVGKLVTRAGDTVEAVFRIYTTEQGGDPLWKETQRVTIAEDGSYTVLLGSESTNGLAQAVFAGGAARWMGVSVERGAEQDRVLLSSVPYAMKSADAESLAGHAASDFVTQEQLAQLTQSTGRQGTSAAALEPLTSGTLTGAGTDGAIPLWTGTQMQGNSEITQVGSDIGINMASPGATLDVGGSENVEGILTLPAQAPATASAGHRSQLLEFTDSAWSSATGKAAAQTWRLYATDSGNNSANPTSSLNFQFQNGAGTATPTVLSIAQNGVITFAPTQTFPGMGSGTITGITTTSPLTGSGTSGSVTLGLDESALGTAITPSLTTTFNTKYAQLSAENLFAQSQVAFNTAGTSNGAFNGVGLNGYSGSFSSSDSGIGAKGTTTTGLSGMLGNTGGLGSASGTYSTEIKYQSAGVWGDTTAATGSQYGAGVIGTADNADGGTFFNNSTQFAAVYAQNLGAGVGLSGAAGSSSIGVQGVGGTGMYGTSPTVQVTKGVAYGSGVHGVLVSPSAEGATVAPQAAGVWADTSSIDGAGLLATADAGAAAYFYNQGTGGPTVFILNEQDAAAHSVVLETAGGTGSGECTIDSAGDLQCSGSVSDIAKLADSESRVETYSVQSAEHWFEDAGTAQLVDGAAHVDLEPIFGGTVNTSVEYHVFLTPDGDCKGLYVSQKSAGGFDVRELGGGTSAIAFEYRIMAKRAGYENVRLLDVTDRLKRHAEQREKMRHPATDGPQIHPTQRLPAIPTAPVSRVPQVQSPTPRPVVIPAFAKPGESR